METNLKLLLEDLRKQVHDEIKLSHEEIMGLFDAHTDTIDRRISEFVAEGVRHDDRVATLESIAATFNSSFTEWKPQVEDSTHFIKLELSKLNSYFNYDAKESSNTKPDVLNIE
jgi:hypothetical protein